MNHIILDSDWRILCDRCRKIIEPGDPKVIVGRTSEETGYQLFSAMHPQCAPEVDQ